MLPRSRGWRSQEAKRPQVCGIVGIVERDGARVDADLLGRAITTLRHRGPDDEGTWISPDGRVGLAHRRLAIIDLSPGGHQPMSAAGGRLQVTFHGEIYNYRSLRAELGARGHAFHTSSDTEVLLAAYREWGTACVERLRGMFALALYDGDARRLFLARDRAGEKPLFYCHQDGRLAAASELKALLSLPSVPRRLDPRALDHYLAYGYVPGELCLLAGIRKLPPAHAAVYDLDRDHLALSRYWTLPERSPAPPASEDALVEELEALLAESVREQMVADVPVGILLSGGLDSSLVTAMAHRAGTAAPRTFTITFPGHAGGDEGPHARKVARHFGTEHTELAAPPATVSLLPELARQFDEPIADSSMVPTFLVSRLIREHARVALGGDGGDELFGGYPHYGWLAWQERLRPLLPRPLRAAAGVLAARTPPGLAGRNHLIGFTNGTERSVAHVNLYFDASSRDRLLAPLGGATPAPEALNSFAERAMYLDTRYYLPDDILVKVDRASMLTSLEVRAPFLDHRLVEFAFGRVPDHLRATARGRKVLPRRLARRLLPSDLDLERKQGFSLPLASWFRGEWGRFAEEVLEGADPALFHAPFLRGLVAGQRRGRRNSHRLFALTLFELWRREYRVSL